LRNLRRTSPPKDWFKVGAEAKRRRDDGTGRVPLYARQGTIQLGVVVPFLLAACLTAIRYNHRLDLAGTPDELVAGIWGVAKTAGVAVFVSLALIHCYGRFYRSYRSMKGAVLALSLATVGAALAAFGLFWVLGQIVAAFESGAAGLWVALTFGTPLTLAAYSFVVVIQLGLLGAQFPDEQREWWSRLRAWTDRKSTRLNSSHC